MINGHHHPYVQAAIEGEVARLAAAVEGERNDILFKSTAALASLGLREGEILAHLKPVAQTIGLRGKELYSTVKSGVKHGHANPRQIPDDSRGFGQSAASPRPIVPVAMAGLPSRTLADADNKPAFFPGDSGGPRVNTDEVRRHVYRRDGVPVRIKIKFASGAYVNWYRVRGLSGDGWQAGKPEGYVPCPYVGAIDPFDPELARDVLYWPEGEKDCDTLGHHCMPAFTFGGTGDGLPREAEDYLRGRHVVIFADNDPTGGRHADAKAALAHPVAASVKVIGFPQLAPKGDVSDFIRAEGVARLEQLVAETPLWAPASEQAPADPQWRRALIAASDLKLKSFEPVRYVLPGYIPEGVTIFAGKPKIGKSWFLYDVCLACAADRFVLGTLKPTQGDVLYLALEDSQRRLKHRLVKLLPHGNGPARLSLTTEWRRADAGGVSDIAEWCDSVERPVLVVIDTLEKFRPMAKAHSSAYTTDYQALVELHRLAHQRGIAIVVVHHVRKMEAEDPFDMVSGTNGLTGAADTLLVLKRQAGNLTLYSRGRDIDERETACQFDKETCRWTLLGDAAEVHTSGERAAILTALQSVGDAGMHTLEIMVATGRRDRNAVDQLLFKMKRDGDLVRVKRGVYAIAGKNDKKERSSTQVSEPVAEKNNLIVLTDLTGVGRSTDPDA